MAEEAIRYRITADGADLTAKAFERVAGSQKAANEQFKVLSASASKSATTLAALGGSLGRIAPEFGALGQAVGRASGAIQGMTGVLGGPWGLAIGAAVAGLGLFSEWLRSTREEAEKTTTSVSDLAGELADIRSKMDARRQFRASMEEAGDIFAGASGLDDKANLEALEAYIKSHEGLIDENVTDKKGPRRATFAELQRRAQTERQLEALDKLGRGQSVDQMYAGADRAQGRLAAGAAGMQADARQSVIDAQVNAHRKLREDLLDLDRQYYEDNAKLEAEAAKNRERYQAVAIDAAQSLERVSISGMQKIAKGQKFTVRELLSGVGDEMVAGGTKWVMEGTGRLIASYGTDPSGWGLIGLGTAEVGFGLGLGAATRPGGAGSAGGGRQRPMSPLGSGGGGGSGEPQHITINMPTVVSPGPQDGVRVQQALDEGRRAGLVRAA